MKKLVVLLALVAVAAGLTTLRLSRRGDGSEAASSDPTPVPVLVVHGALAATAVILAAVALIRS